MDSGHQSQRQSNALSKACCTAQRSVVLGAVPLLTPEFCLPQVSRDLQPSQGASWKSWSPSSSHESLQVTAIRQDAPRELVAWRTQDGERQ